MARIAFRRAGVAAALACAAAVVAGAATLHEHPLLPAGGTPLLSAGGGPVAPAGGQFTESGTAARGPVTTALGVGPGSVTETPGAGICTAGFVFTGGGRTYLGQAAHCAGTGPDTETDGCTSSTLRPGVPVTVRGPGGPVSGTLRYSSWTAMQDGGESDPDICAYNDFALVELRGPVGSSLPLLGGPAAVRDTPPAPGSAVFGLATPASPSVRAGSAGPDRGGGWLHTVRARTGGSPGESGGPLVDDRGLALGVLSGMEAGGERKLEYTDLARALDYARRHGAPADLTLLPGTAPFTAPPPPA